jgi:uncharacterized protein YdcH (DUF465 family)
MNISLRKASAIQASINDAIKSIKIDVTIELNEFQNVETELAKANNTLFANDARRQKLLLALYNIRALVGTANAQSGIDSKLATAAFVDKRVGQLEELGTATVVTDLAVINGKLEKIKNDKSETSRRSSIYGYSDTVSTSVVGQEQLDQIKAEIKHLKKQKQKLNDEILELNIKTEVPLSDEVVATLQAEGLI